VLAVIGGLLGGFALDFAIYAAAGGDDAPPWALAVSILGADALLLGLIVLAARRGTERLGAATLGLRRTRLRRALGWAVLAWVTFSLTNLAWSAVVPGEPTDATGTGPSIDEINTVVLALFILGIAVTVPIVEEIAFRGYLFAALSRWRGPWIAAVATGIVFGVAHLAAYPLEYIPPLMVMGFVLCLIFWFTGSLLPAIALHSLNNAIVTGWQLGWTWQVPLLGLACVVAAMAIVWPFTRERAPQQA